MSLLYDKMTQVDFSIFLNVNNRYFANIMPVSPLSSFEIISNFFFYHEKILLFFSRWIVFKITNKSDSKVIR